MPREKQRDEREQGDEREHAVVAAEQAPRRAGVAPVDKFEKAGHDDFFVVIAQANRSTSHLVNWSSVKMTSASAAMRRFDFWKIGLAAAIEVQSPKSSVQSQASRDV